MTLDTVSVTITPGRLTGQVDAPPSKSISHRMLIGAALADGQSVLSGLSFSEDITATMDALTALGARFERMTAGNCDPCGGEDETLCVYGCGGRIAPHGGTLFCRESGSTLRFLIPLCLLSPQACVLQGSARLFSRPLSVYEQLFADRMGERSVENACPKEGGKLQILAGDRLSGREYQLPGDISSQFVSGLLFALPLCGEDSRIELIGETESRSYIDLTLDALHRFGVRVYRENARVLRIPGGQKYRPYDGHVEGDASNAAFFAALNYLGSEVQVTGVLPESLQGDRVYDALFRRLAARAEAMPVIDLADCPDLAPILFTVAAETGGAVFTHTDRLRLKECDRIAAMQEELAKFGAKISATDGENGGTVRVFPTRLSPPEQRLDGHNDHRVVMSLSVLATKYGGTICGADAVKKSFPDFFARLRSLGAQIKTGSLPLQKGRSNDKCN